MSFDAYAAQALTAMRALCIPVFLACVDAAHPRTHAFAADGFLEHNPVVSKPFTFPFEVETRWGWCAGLIFAFAAASDVLDGRLARRAGTASNAGRFFDHFADIGFILAALTMYVVVGLAPWWVPASIALSFTFYLVDSIRRTTRAPSLIGSRLGHWGGVANYVLIGVLVFNDSAAIELLPPSFVYLLFILVPLYSLGAIAARVLSASERNS